MGLPKNCKRQGRRRIRGKQVTLVTQTFLKAGETQNQTEEMSDFGIPSIIVSGADEEPNGGGK